MWWPRGSSAGYTTVFLFSQPTFTSESWRIVLWAASHLNKKHSGLLRKIIIKIIFSLGKKYTFLVSVKKTAFQLRYVYHSLYGAEFKIIIQLITCIAIFKWWLLKKTFQKILYAKKYIFKLKIVLYIAIYSNYCFLKYKLHYAKLYLKLLYNWMYIYIYIKILYLSNYNIYYIYIYIYKILF